MINQVVSQSFSAWLALRKRLMNYGLMELKYEEKASEQIPQE
jgi:hypothetical protein